MRAGTRSGFISRTPAPSSPSPTKSRFWSGMSASRSARFQSMAPAREKYGLHHYAPYEPDKYIRWARQSGMKLFLGNLEDPSLRPSEDEAGFRVYPSAFWLEPAWRDTRKFTIDWLLAQARVSDIVLLFHPENVLADPSLIEDLKAPVESRWTPGFWNECTVANRGSCADDCLYELSDRSPGNS